MKAAVGFIVLATASFYATGQTYKWVDDNGITNYGEKPPENVRAVPVDTQPRGVIETGGEVKRRVDTESRKGPETRPIQVIPVPVSPSYARASPVRGMAFDTYIRLERGMSEGELLVRAGPPDHETVENVWDYPAKTYYYLPTVSDPYTTVIRLRGGQIADVERIKKF